MGENSAYVRNEEQDETCLCEICASQDVETIEGSHLEPLRGSASSKDTTIPQEKVTRFLVQPSQLEDSPFVTVGVSEF